MYFEFLLECAHARRRVERMYSSGVRLNSFAACSKEVAVIPTGVGPSGLPQFELPRCFAMGSCPLYEQLYTLGLR
jgi:hypothetical protein